MKFYIIALIAVILNIISQLILKYSANKSEKTIGKIFVNINTVIAYTLLLVSISCTTIALKALDMKELIYLLPLSYIFVPLLAQAIFKEKISSGQKYGILIVFIGLIVFNLDL